MNNGAPDCGIILAAGKGTRMGSATTPKVCFPVNGVPAVCRALATYRACGISQYILIVGSLAGKVVETVGERFDNVAFVYQKDQLGTAHALRCVYNNISLLDDDADVFIAAGDRIIDQNVLEKFFNLYSGDNSELAVLALRCSPESGQGRIVRDSDGTPVAVLEMADIRQRRVLRQLRSDALAGISRSAEELRDVIVKGFFGAAECKPAKAEKAFGAIWKACESGKAIPAAELAGMIPESMTMFELPAACGRIVLTPEEAAGISCGNTSVYLLKSGLLKRVLGQLSHDNAQQEEYLSDLVGLHARAMLEKRRRPDTLLLEVEDRARILGFNNPAELLEVEKMLGSDGAAPDAAELDPAEFRSLGEWLRLFNGAPELEPALKQIYGSDPTIWERQKQNILQVLNTARQVMSADTLCGIVRSPGRLNVMGRHIDHQGGNCNLMTIGFETVMAVSPRDDDRVVIRHCDPERFAGCDFSIAELVADLPWDDWTSLVNSSKLAKMISEYGVDWSQYIKAAVLRLQKKFSKRKLRGMTLVVGGNVPMAAGLSSSSSLVVGAAEAVVAVNRLDTFPAQIVTLCGEGEWFVGTRGGSADHAAVKMGQRGTVVKVRFFPFGVDENVAFPENYSMVICDSGIKARKSADAKNQFNHRIACYRIGFALIRRLLPQFSGVLEHLRDVTPHTLQMPLSFFYRLLLMLPEYATRDELRALLPDEPDLDVWFASHAEPADGRYPIRGVVLFGMSECERAARYAELLKKGDLAAIGRMMKRSHDGDRVVSHDENWQEQPFRSDVSNTAMLNLLSDLESGAPDRVIRAQLDHQSGVYACSLPEIDLMVDIAARTPGVMGAQLAGAGLGGCMMVLCKDDAIPELLRRLDELYYRPAGRPAATMVCRPVAGSGLIAVPPRA